MQRHVIRAGSSAATISRYGGQVLSWNHGGTERLFLAAQATFAPGSAIRGGIPVIFPQFGQRGPGPRHGFARTSTWALLRGGREGDATVELGLRDTRESRALWPCGFEATLAIAVAEDRLSVRISVANTGQDRASFTCALHSYLRVDDIATTSIDGLQGIAYEDATRAGAWAVQEQPRLSFAGEVDRVYRDSPACVALASGGATVRIEQQGFRDTVVWNPGAGLAAGMPDLGPGEQRHFACVEAACVHQPVELAPGASWDGSQTLVV